MFVCLLVVVAEVCMIEGMDKEGKERREEEERKK